MASEYRQDPDWKTKGIMAKIPVISLGSCEGTFRRHDRKQKHPKADIRLLGLNGRLWPKVDIARENEIDDLAIR